MKFLDFSIDVILTAAIWHWGSTHPVTNEYQGIFLKIKMRLAHKADSLTAICEPNV
jgi:hypothetical protein